METLKKVLYFPLASYFKFFAARRLRKWKPQIIVVTGSNGKTTLLHLLESQLGDKAKFSHHANSAYGIPFDILDLHRKTLQSSEWVSLFLKAPFQVSRALPKEKIYVVEADADRPGEGKFLAELLKPDVVLWVSTGRTHSMNFDELVTNGKFKGVEEAIAYEYGHFLEQCQKLAIIDGDSPLEILQTERTKAKVISVKKDKWLKRYSVGKEGTTFTIEKKQFTFSALLPEEVYASIVMCQEVMEYVHLPFDASFKKFHIPPGRGTLFHGVNNITIIDSTYNANLGSLRALLSMFGQIRTQNKWVVIGDMKELGKEEKEEHETLGKMLNDMNLEKIILVGKLVAKYTLPRIKDKRKAVSFEKTSDAKQYLHKHLIGGETVLFKGSQSIFLEGLIEPFLKNEADSIKLPRQEYFWQTRRKKLGL